MDSKLESLLRTRNAELERELAARNRDLAIEASLERVRVVAMGMLKPDDLSGICETMFQELKKLGFAELRNAMIDIHYDEQAYLLNYDYSENSGKTITRFIYNSHPIVDNIVYHARQSNDVFTERVYAGKDLQEWRNFRKKNGEADDERLNSKEALYYYFYAIGAGAIGISTFSAATAEQLNLLKRFRNVFDLAYRRYTDIELAIEQAREAQIEASLEKVRSRSLAMHHTEELREVVSVVLEKLQELDIVRVEEAASIVIFTEGTKDLVLWNAIPDQLYSKAFHIPYYDTAVITSLLDAKSDGAQFFERNYTKAEKDHFWKWAVEYSDYKHIPDERKKHILASEHFACSIAYTKNSAILISSYDGKLLSEKESVILERFAKVFEQAYVRFIDLQNAEAQAREARVEAALERVRGKTMAMHNSQDVADTVGVMFGELVKLGVDKTVRCGIGIIEETRQMEVWTAYSDPDNDKVDLVIGVLDMTSHQMLNGVFGAWKNKERHSTYTLTGKDQENYYRAINNSKDYSFKFDIASLPEKQFQNAFYFSEGFIYVFSHEQLTAEEVQIYKRFAGVFGLTYRRFLDLQKAEAQAHEAKVEAALERVRSRTLAMQNSAELSQTAAVLFKQLIDLGIQPNRLFIGIIHDDSGDIEFWVTAEDGSKISNKFVGNVSRNGSVKKMYNGWKAHKKSLAIDMQGKELLEYFNYLGKELKVPFNLGLSQKRRVELIAYFSQGFIGMASPEPQPEETTGLLERFAGVFNLTYTRFNDLKIAEAHAIQAEEDLVKLHKEKQRAEDALTNLQAAQRQLVQSEKMASLGELTAGIAHEIQNPLNFVNNFSEVSVELLQELKEGAEAGNIEDVIAIVADLTQNLERISHHGKRADAIVKGMLEHSRVGTGEKQPTDLNALADEFLKLSYHGLRAKDQSLNAEIIKHFDANLPEVNVIQQDIGRALLNLFNNAFYAVNQKAKAAYSDYKPTIEVSTLTRSGWVELYVKDNGHGIPDAIKEKIMQPFFTTKPTGEGTGLGLSLSYDIVVKGHGGSIDVDTKENEYTVFTIKLPL